MGTQIIHIIFLVLFVYLLVNVLYLLFLAIAGRLRHKPAYNIHPSKKRIAVLIPSLREDHIIVHTAREARAHDYPKESFEVFIAADGLQAATVESLRLIPVQVLEVEFELGSKARSLNRLLNSIPENRFDIAIILDADNVMLPGCLEKVNDAFQKGYKAVQCHRVAKNLNTPVAILDAMSEEINNHFFRQAQRALGFSSATIGSGMAFEFKKIKEIYNKPGILGNPACDREVDFEMMKAGTCIEFIPDAYVLDEKVASKTVFERQRTRWLESQLIHLRLFFDKSQGSIPKTIHYWNKLFINLIPPRLIFLFTFFLLLLVFLLEKLLKVHILFPAPIDWALLTLLCVAAFVLSIPRYFYSRQSLRSLYYIPVLMYSMIKAIFSIKVGRKEFLHTPKSYTQDMS